MSEFRGDDFRGLQGALQRTGDHNVELEIQRRERPAHVMGLLLTRLVDGPLVVVPGGIVVVGTGMTQEVDVHDEYFALIAPGPSGMNFIHFTLCYYVKHD